MLIKTISFLTYLENIRDIENRNIDVFVELENVYTYTVVVEPAKNIEADPLDDTYWLKLYHFARKVDPTVFNQLQVKHINYLKELDELNNS